MCQMLFHLTTLLRDPEEGNISAPNHEELAQMHLPDYTRADRREQTEP